MPTRTAQIAETIRRRISSRALGAGEKLPSIRGFATTMRVSPSTVVEAYDRLAAEGLIQARRGAGFYVAERMQPFAVAETAPQLDRAVDPFWVSRQSLDAAEGMRMPGCGWLPADWMPGEALRRALRQLGRAGDRVLTEYGGTGGALNLRRLLARQMADEGLALPPEQILLAQSGTQAIDLICRFLLKPGDRVLVDDPCYFNFLALLRAHQVQVLGVPYTENGPDPARFEAAMRTHKPRLYITNSGLQNPTGASLSPRVAHRILTLAALQDMIVVEDDIFAAFEPAPSIRLATLDGLERVIRIGSFSKTLSASVRCGYIAAKPEWITALTDLQVATTFAGPGPLAAELVHHVLHSGSFRKHMDGLRTRLTARRREVTARLAALDIHPWTTPRGGFYLWCRLPEAMDAADLARAALHEDMVLAPGNVFSPAQTMPGFMRFNISQMGAGIYESLDRALERARNA